MSYRNQKNNENSVNNKNFVIDRITILSNGLYD